MYSQEGLRYAITGLFCSRMGEDGYTMHEAAFFILVHFISPFQNGNTLSF